MIRMNVHSVFGGALIGLTLALVPASGCELAGDTPNDPEPDGGDSLGEFSLATPSLVEVTVTNAANEPITSIDPEPQWGFLTAARSESTLTIERLEIGLSDLIITEEVGGSSVPLHLTDVWLGISAASSSAMSRSETATVVPVDFELNWSLVGSGGQVQPLPSQMLSAVDVTVTVANGTDRILVDADVPGLLWDFGEIAVADLVVSLTVLPAK